MPDLPISLVNLHRVQIMWYQSPVTSVPSYWSAGPVVTWLVRQTGPIFHRLTAVLQYVRLIYRVFIVRCGLCVVWGESWARTGDAMLGSGETDKHGGARFIILNHIAILGYNLGFLLSLKLRSTGRNFLSQEEHSISYEHGLRQIKKWAC